MISKALYSSNSDEWATPEEIFNQLDDEFHFNLDPCASDTNYKCDKYYTAENDGLSQDWGGTECSAIHLIVKLINGLKNHIERVGMITHLLFCLYLQGRTQDIFTILFINVQRYVLSKEG